MSKYKILVAPSDNFGSGKYRSIDPHICLQNNHSEDFFVEINHTINFSDYNYLKNFDAIIIHRLPQHDYVNAINIIKNIKKLGLKVVIDTDDYWHLDPSHGAYEQAKKDGIPEVLLNCIKLADLVTVPTILLANEVRKFNTNVNVLANAIDPKEVQFNKKSDNPTNKVRIGWMGGSSHLKDIELLKKLSTLGEDYHDKSQLVLCGFDTRGSVKERDKTSGQIIERGIRPTETVWFLYELFLTNNYRMLEKYPDYIKFLTQFKEDPSYDDSAMPYKRVWTKPINTYAKNYNLFDVGLAPLVENKFNMFKSQLKVIECGFNKTPIIAQNYGPYTIDLIDGKNALLVDSAKNHKQWQKHAKYLIDNPHRIKELGDELYNTVKDKYDINNVTKERAKIYLNLLK